jgi:hypothetical protein
VARSYAPRAQSVERAYEIILALPHTAAEEEGFVRITTNPSAALAAATGYAGGGARVITAELTKQGRLKYIQNGGEKRPDGRRGHAWLVKLPDGQQRLSFDADESHPPEVVEFERTFSEFSKAFANVYGLVQQAGQLRRERDEARREAQEATAKLDAVKQAVSGED